MLNSVTRICQALPSKKGGINMPEDQEGVLVREFRKLPVNAKNQILRYLKRLNEGAKQAPHLRLVKPDRPS